MSQMEILDLLKKYPNNWFSNKEIARRLKLIRVAHLTSKLFRSELVLKKTKPLTNRRWFKYKKRKRIIDLV